MVASSPSICGFSLCPGEADMECQLKVISGTPGHECGQDHMMAESGLASNQWAVSDGNGAPCRFSIVI